MCQDENNLLKRLAFSDDEAFKILFLKYQPVLFKFIYFKTCDDNLTQDIVQETFLKVWLNRASLKPELSFFSYLAKISSNLLKDHNKHFKVKEKYKNSIPQINPSLHDNPDQALNFQILTEQLNVIANRYLTEICRTIFFLSRVEGKSNTEIAEMLDISKKKVENQLYLALKIMRKKLDI